MRTRYSHPAPSPQRVWQDCDVLLVDDSSLNRARRIKYEPSSAWLEFLAITREKESEFTCRHSKLLWQSCIACRRSPSEAKANKERLIPRVIEMLSEV